MKNTILTLIIALLFCSCNRKSGKNETQVWELAPNIHVLDKYKPIYSLAELSEFFKDKTVYIDRWATWCSPCLEEFKYGDSLHKFLNDNSIKMVYLNSDKDIQDSVFYQFIVSHNLFGYHLRLNDSLKNELSDKKIFIPIIPQFMIMDKRGQIVDNKALRPSNGDSLYLQLTEYSIN
jgi:thiol-disulfide isomerase/thioredoxin